jgi:hypothetical protein
MSVEEHVKRNAAASSWIRDPSKIHLRRLRLTPGVIGLCIVVVLGGVGTGVLGAAGMSLFPPRFGSSLSMDYCIACPNNDKLCYPTCYPPTISNVNVALQTQNSLTRQAWINWSYADNGSAAGNFRLSIGETGAPIPPSWNNSGGKADINLNALKAGTTYTYLIEESDAAGTAQYSGQFSTNPAPTNEFVGWVSTLTSNPYQADPLGNPIPGETVGIEASCGNPVYGLETLLFDTSGTTGDPDSQTSSNGAYAITFPLSALTINGAAEYAYALTSNGVCTTYNVVTDQETGTYSNSDYTLVAGGEDSAGVGYWNATQYVSSTLAATTDYQQFGLYPNFGQLVPVSLALIHTTYDGATYDNANCSYTWYTSTTQAKVSQDIFFGSENAQSSGNSVGSGWNDIGSDGADGGLSLDYPVTGYVNETGTDPYFALGDTSLAGNEIGATAGPYTVSDWMSDPHYAATASPGNGWIFANPSQNNQLQKILFTQGTYGSITGYSVDISLSAGWAGESIGGTISVTSTVTVTTSISNTLECYFNYHKDPSGDGGNPYFWIYVGSPATGVDHIWLEGWCGGTDGEPSC